MADTLGLGPSGVTPVEVRLLSPAPVIIRGWDRKYKNDNQN